MNGEAYNRRGDDPAIKAISDDLARLSEQYRTHITKEDDTSFSSLVRKNLPVLVALVLQAIGFVWWLGSFVGDVKRNQELTNLKLSYLEKQLGEWYSKSDAARDMALRDSVDNEMKRRIDTLENIFSRGSR